MPDRFLVHVWHVHRSQVAAAILLSQVDRVQTIGLAMVARLGGDQTRGDDLAVETVVVEGRCSTNPAPEAS